MMRLCGYLYTLVFLTREHVWKSSWVSLALKNMKQFSYRRLFVRIYYDMFREYFKFSRSGTLGC